MHDRSAVALRVGGRPADPAGAGAGRVRQPPGHGQAAAGLSYGRPDHELWWLKGYVAREGLPTDPMLPPSLQLAKEIERLPEAVRELATEAEVRESVRDLNRRIAEHLRAPSGRQRGEAPAKPSDQAAGEQLHGPQVAVRPVSADRAVARWRDDRAGPPPAPPED